MKSQLRNALTAVILLLIPTLTFAQAPTLGTAANFVLFSTVGAVGNTGISQITGNVGTNSGAITGFGNVNGVMHTSDGATAQCAADLLIAYNQLNAAVPTFFPAPLLGNGQILIAGVYSISGAATLNLDLTLNAQGNANAVFIFQIQGPFSAAANSKVNLINGALACNVFWKVEGLVSMAAGTTMRGTVVANNAAINMNAGDTLEGRALSTTGAVNVNGVLAYTPIGCGSPVLTGPAPPSLASTECYALFSSDGPVSNAGVTYVTGDVGTNVGLTTGFNPLLVTGMIHPIPDGSTAQCAADLLNVYTYLNALPYDIELLYPAQFGNNLVLTPHTYLMNAATTFTGNLYLNAQGYANAVFVIKIYGALSTSTYSNVILTNGTLAKNVYWLVSGAVSINNYSVFKGTIICNNGAIDLTTGVALEGRALTTTGALGTAAIIATMPPGCAGTSSPSIITQPSNQTACVGSSVSFSVSATGTGLTFQWRKGTVNLTNGGNISGATSATLTFNPVNTSNAASDYNVVVSGTFPPSVTSTNASLVVNPLPGVFNVTGGGAYCSGGTGVAVGLSGSATGINYALYNGAILVTTLPGTGAVLNFGLQTVAGTYTVVATNASTTCTNNMSGNAIVTVNPLPAVFNVTGGGAYCSGGIGVSVGLSGSATGINYALYNGAVLVTTSPGTGTALNFGLQTVAGTYTVVATNTSTTCTNNMSGNATVTVNPLPAVFNVTGGGAYCSGGTGVEVGLSGSATGINYALYNETVLVTTLPGTGVALNFGLQTSAGTYTVIATNASTTCISNMSGSATVIINNLPTPTISGFTNLCVNSGFYNYTTESGMTGYVWTVSAGGTITFGQGTNQIEVTWNDPGAQTVSVTYTNTSGCSPVAPTILNVTVNPLPGNAGSISGSTAVCGGAQGIPYSTPTISNTVTYVWTLPAGATIASGAGTPSITVNFDAYASSGTISVYGNNLCGNGNASSLAITVTQLPAVAGTITGEEDVCEGSTGVIYSVEPIANATDYNWTVPAGASIVSGSNTNSITVDFSMSAVSGNITVYGSNYCGNGASSPAFEVTVNPIPETPWVTANGDMLLSSAPAGNQWYYEGTLIQGATDQTYQATFSGWYWTIVSLSGCSTDSSNHVYVLMVGLPELQLGDVNVYPVPNDGRFTVSIVSPYQEPFTITVFSYIGVKILEVKDILVKKHFDQIIDLRPAVNGVYYIVIQNKSINYNKIKKVVIHD